MPKNHTSKINDNKAYKTTNTESYVCLTCSKEIKSKSPCINNHYISCIEYINEYHRMVNNILHLNYPEYSKLVLPEFPDLLTQLIEVVEVNDEKIKKLRALKDSNLVEEKVVNEHENCSKLQKFLPRDSARRNKSRIPIPRSGSPRKSPERILFFGSQILNSKSKVEQLDKVVQIPSQTTSISSKYLNQPFELTRIAQPGSKTFHEIISRNEMLKLLIENRRILSKLRIQEEFKDTIDSEKFLNFHNLEHAVTKNMQQCLNNQKSETSLKKPIHITDGSNFKANVEQTLNAFLKNLMKVNGISATSSNESVELKENDGTKTSLKSFTKENVEENLEHKISESIKNINKIDTLEKEQSLKSLSDLDYEDLNTYLKNSKYDFEKEEVKKLFSQESANLENILSGFLSQDNVINKNQGDKSLDGDTKFLLKKFAEQNEGKNNNDENPDINLSVSKKSLSDVIEDFFLSNLEKQSNEKPMIDSKSITKNDDPKNAECAEAYSSKNVDQLGNNYAPIDKKTSDAKQELDFFKKRVTRIENEQSASKMFTSEDEIFLNNFAEGGEFIQGPNEVKEEDKPSLSREESFDLDEDILKQLMEQAQSFKSNKSSRNHPCLPKFRKNRTNSYFDLYNKTTVNYLSTIKENDRI